MGKMYASNGDMISVMRNGEEAQFEVVVDPDDSSVIRFERRLHMCEACGVNESYTECIEEFALCPTCMRGALSYIALQYAMEMAGRENDTGVEILRAVRALRRADNAHRNDHVPYYDSESVAMDTVRGYTRDELHAEFTECIRIVESWIMPQSIVQPGDDIPF